MSLYPAGVQTIGGALTGSELVSVDAGGAVKAQVTTAQIAALAATTSTGSVLTTVSTVGAGTLTAAAIIGKNINRTGIQTGAFIDTTDTAANIIAALPAGAPVGTSFLLTISNNQTATTGYVETVTGGSGVTVSGITAIATGQTAEYLVTYSAAATVTMVGRLDALSGNGVLSLVGSSSGQTNIVPTAAATGVLTLPAVTADTFALLAATQVFTNKTLTSPTLTTPALGVATATSINGVTITTGTGTLTLGTFTLTLAGNFTTTGAFNTTFAQTASATYTLTGVAGTLAQTSGSNLAIIDAYRCTSAQTANANVVPANITGLSGAVAIGTYTFRASIYCTIASGTGGIAINQALTTAVLSACNFQAKGYTASAVAVQATTTATSGTALFTQAAVVLQIDIEGSFTVSTAGTFALQMCQNTSNGSNSVVNIGSTMTLTRIA